MDPISEIPGLRHLWERANGGDPAIRIAIIDGPVDLNHPSLKGSRLSLSGLDAQTKSLIKSEHGTHVTSVLMGARGSSVPGIASNCTATIYSIYREGDGGELISSSQSTLAMTINRALADGADVINISSGQLTPTGQAERILADAVRSCERAGKLLVAAAGNDGCRCLHVPASLQSVLAVGACDLDGRPLPFSNFGDAYLKNGILAPGKDVKGASPSQDVAMRSGTSFATPVVTGVIALLLSLQRMCGRDPDPSAIKEAVLTTATPCQPGNGGAGQPGCLNGVLNISGIIATLFADDELAGHAPASQFGLGAGATRVPLHGGISDFLPTRALQLSGGEAGEQSMGEVQTNGIEASSYVPGHEGNPAGVAAVNPAEAPPMPAQAAANAARGGAVATAPSQTAVPGVQVSEAACGCGVRPAQTPIPAEVPGNQVAYLDPVLTTALHGPAGTRQMAFPLGQVYYDFGKEARIDYFVQAIASWRDSLGDRGQDPNFGPNRDRAGDNAAPYNPEIMARYLMDLAPGEERSPTPVDINFRDADALIWTLTIDTIPIYAVKPLDVFGLGFYSSLVQALWLQEVSPEPPSKVTRVLPISGGPGGPAQTSDGFPPKGRISRVSFAGWLDPAATTRLLNGTVLPTLVTDWRGFYQWDLYTLLGDNPDDWPEGAADFLDRIYNEFRNAGVSPQDRALNYSAMNALRVKQIFTAEIGKRRLDTVEVDKSTICRPDSDCWDVTYRFFDPTAVLTQARQVYQYTIDVSDVVPVPVGRVRKWAVY